MSSASRSGQGAASSPFGLLPAHLFANPLVPLLVAGAAVVAVVAVLLLWAGAPDYRVLYSNLSEADGGRIIAELDSRAIPYEFSQGGRALLVPGDQVHKLRLQMAEQGLPEGGNSGFEIMDRQEFGISQFAEQVNFQRSLQGELAKSIESLGPVAQARVHLAMAKPSVFIRDREPAKASVVLSLQPGRALGDGQVDAVAHLVSSSVPELALENVTVVDQAGRLLSRPGAEGSLDGTQLDYVHEVERRYQQRIENILAPILGRDNVRAQVAAQVNFDQREETSERYTPNQDGRPAAVRSARRNTSYDGDAEVAAGIPGALSNTPPGSALSPIQTLPDGKDGPGTEEVPPDSGRMRSDELINYEVDRDIVHIQHRRGRIERLSVAVVVNYHETETDDGETEQLPLTTEELERIEQLARRAMGYSQVRGDGLEVVNSRFTETAEPAEQIVTDWWESPFWQHFLLTLVRYLLAGIAALLLFLWVVRPLLERYNRRPVEPVRPQPAPQAAPADTDSEHDGKEPQEEPAPRRRRRASAYEQNLKELQDMAHEDPSLVAMIVRSWMNRND